MVNGDDDSNSKVNTIKIKNDKCKKKIMPKTPLIDPVYDQLMVNECHEHRVAWELLDLISVCGM